MESWSTCTSKCLNESFLDQGLPPGFRFHPTDEELVTHYLAKKLENPNFACRAVVEADLNKFEPWELPGKAAMGEKEWYFYSARDRKYPTGMRTNRATQAGYWKATGKDREVVSSNTGGGRSRIVGMKKTLVFYRGRAPKGVKSNWVMHEYRHEPHLLNRCRSSTSASSTTTSTSKDEWVVCRVFHKSQGGKKMALSELNQTTNTGGALYTTSLPALLDSPTRAVSGSGGAHSDQEALMLNAFLHYTNNPIKSEPIHGDGGSDGTGLASMTTQNAIANPMCFLTSRSQIDPHLTTRGGSHNQGESSLNTILSNAFNTQSKISSSTHSNDHNYHHQLSSMQYISPTPFMDPLLNSTSTSLAPTLSRLPSDLDTYWLFSDRLQ